MFDFLIGRTVDPILLPPAPFTLADIWYLRNMYRARRDHLEKVWIAHGTGKRHLPEKVSKSVLNEFRRVCHMMRVLDGVVDRVWGPHIAEINGESTAQAADTGRSGEKVVRLPRTAHGATITAPVPPKRKPGRPRKRQEGK